MRYLYFFCLLMVNMLFLNAQTNLTSEKWQYDLRYLQEKVHKDYQPLFLKVSQEKFDLEVEKLYHRIPEMKDHEVIVGIAEIIALFEYGHTALWLTSWRYNQLVNFHQMPYNLYQFDEGVFVQGVHKDFSEAVGAKVIKVGNFTVEEAMKAIRPVVSAENDQFFKAHGLNYLGVPEVLHAKGVIKDINAVVLTLEKNGEQFEVSFTPRTSETFPGKYGLIQTNENWLDARQADKTPLWLKNLEKKYFFEYLPNEKIVYVRQSEILDDEDKNIADFYAEVFDFIEKNDVAKMVLDLRLNSGGNNYKNKPVVTGLIKSEKINQPGKLYVILGRRTFSACQNLVNEIENYTNAIFVGEATAENVNFFGDSKTESLPHSNLSIRLSYLWWQDKDPRDTRPWTPPQVVVDMTFKDYESNTDPVLNTIKKLKDFEIPIDPWNHLTSLFMAGKMDELKQKASEYIKNPMYKYYDFETKINDAGYQLMGNGQPEQAIGAFMLNAELFPESANCWSSLAESLWKSGNLDDATQYYKKAIMLDPDGETGANSKRMLEIINKK